MTKFEVIAEKPAFIIEQCCLFQL